MRVFNPARTYILHKWKPTQLRNNGLDHCFKITGASYRAGIKHIDHKIYSQYENGDVATDVARYWDGMMHAVGARFR